MSTSAMSMANDEVVMKVDEDKDGGGHDGEGEGKREGKGEGKVVLDEGGERSVSAASTVMQAGEDGVVA